MCKRYDYSFRIVTPPPIGDRSIVMTVSVYLSVCLSVCPPAYLRKYMSDLYQFVCMSPMAVARSSSGGVAIRCVLPVLWMTSYLRISQGSSTWPPSWSRHSPYAALDVAINGALRALRFWPTRPQWACWIFMTIFTFEYIDTKMMCA